jgi:hypothetical protein
MWPFSNPLECQVAEQCLEQNNPLEAARVLLAAEQPAHRMVRALLLRIGPQLVALGRQAAADGDVLVAAELLEVAARCGSLSPPDETLRRQLVERREQLAQDRQWREQRLDRASQWARDGRLRSALGLVEPLEAEPEAARRRRDWQFDLETLERYGREFEHHLQANELTAASAVLAKANQLAPLDPKVLAMKQALQQAIRQASMAVGSPPVAPPRDSPPPNEPVSDMTQSGVVPSPHAPTASWRPEIRVEPLASGDEGEFIIPHSCQIASAAFDPLVLSGLSVLGDVYVVARPHILIGTAREPGVDLPMSARLHGREALLVRESVARGAESWRVVPLGTALVTVNNERVAAPASRALVDGDILEFESNQCRWRFRMPLKDSATAVLDVVRPAAANVPLPGQGASDFIALVADRLVIAADRAQGHLVQRDLPDCLTLTPSAAGWQITSEGAPLFADSDRLPAQLTMYADRPGLARHVVCDVNTHPQALEWSFNLRRGKS